LAVADMVKCIALQIEKKNVIIPIIFRTYKQRKVVTTM